MFVAYLLVVAALMVPAAERARAQVAQHVVRIGTNSVSGLYYPVGGAICRMMTRTRDAHGYRCLIDSTNGSTANIRGLRNGDLEFGIVQSDWQYHALNGNGAFHQTGAVTDLRAVFSLHAEALTLVVHANSGINDFAQIKGKRIAAGPAGSGQRILFDILTAANGWRTAEIGTLVDAAVPEAVKSFCSGGVDAVVLLTHHPVAPTEEMLERCGGKLVPVTGPTVAKVLKERPYYSPATIAANTYRGQTAEIETLGVRATLVTLASVPSDVVYALVKSVFDNFEEFVSQYPGMDTLRKQDMPRLGLTAPLHDGAKRYFRETGLLP